MERARRALAGAGLAPDTPIERVNSFASEAWLADRFALRVNHRGDLGRMRREAELAPRLPAEARHPGVLAYGRDEEIEWLILPRVAGVQLSRAWPDMDRGQRERAARQLAAALRALHSVTGDLPGDGDFDPPHVLPLEPLLEIVEEVRRAGDAGLMDEIEAFLRARWPAFDERGLGLVHGDPHLENVLWDGEQVSALLDLDWARRSWIEGDLEILLSFCDQPGDFVAPDYQDRADRRDYAEVPGWLADEYPAWFAHPRLADRLEVLFVSRALGFVEDGWPARSSDPTDLSDPRNQLRRLLDGASPLPHWARELGSG
ncbi:MAG TPA: aminoglycoside phosphotransferase family protein [Kofleriaceae bacterium]|nr:aminoglycoside phosphotransferase family protein [Kofleriaceae bacterium]